MTYSPALKWSIALLLPLTIAWKLTVRPDDSSDLTNKLVEFLNRLQFEAVVADSMLDDMPVIRATRGDCSMLVIKSSPHGWDRDLIRQLAPEAAGVFVIFRGGIYAEQPTLLTLISYLWSNFLRELGLLRHATPVIAVAASSTCNAQSLPWNELHERGII